MSQQLCRLETPVIVISPEAYFQGYLKGVFSSIIGDEYYQGFRVVVSWNLERDCHSVTLKEMPCSKTLH